MIHNCTHRLILTLIVTLTLSACDSGQANQQTEAKAIYRSAVFQAEPQLKSHRISAFVEPTDNALLSFQVSGTINKQHIFIGDVVEKDAPLFSIKNPSLEPRIKQTDAEIKAINAILAQNRAELNRLVNLKKTNAVSQNDLDRLKNQNKNLLAKRDGLKAQLTEAQQLFDETQLTAPFRGTVAEIHKEPGETIASGEPIMLLGGIDSLEAPVYLTSQLQKNLSHGQKINAHYDNQSFTVSIKEVSQAANPKSQLFKVVLDVPMSLGIKSGEQITINIPEQLGKHYALPVSAIIDDGIDKPYILVIDNNQVIQVHVKILHLNNQQMLVDLNTSMGNLGAIQVVTEGQSHLTAGQSINLSNSGSNP